ncbi:MarR family transcriptional regulator [Clostridium sp. AM58-1XD]|uniref:MarR family winged helix-turn-helix transcriptional regulator n=1 Tax=Clostridium sp. AM58-1XD TaxID=2292307 RepID=UPI000E514E35|nr:MarR family transcriptional regulator [Clostridium sp. AM58-1XD]RGZ01291.1 MarR family transcriptional regulator [Clostridium sp. AM58-1XD]
MKSETISEKFVHNLLLVMPNWHSKLVRPLKDNLNREMSLETYYCLQTLKNSGTVTMTGLAQQLKVPKQQVTKLVDKLSEHHFVERLCNEDDRRAVLIRLTPEAILYLDEYYRKHTAFIESLEKQLSEEELEKLNQAVEYLREILPKLE